MEIKNFIKERINELRGERGWTVYKLAQESNIHAQTIHNWLDINAMPTVQNLYSICEAFGVTLADFFSCGRLVEVTEETKSLHRQWCALTPDQQSSIRLIISNYLKNP